MFPTLEDNVPSTSKVEPSNDKLGDDSPPSLNVPPSKSKTEPSVELKLFDLSLPVVIWSPLIFVVFVSLQNLLWLELVFSLRLFLAYSSPYKYLSISIYRKSHGLSWEI